MDLRQAKSDLRRAAMAARAATTGEVRRLATLAATRHALEWLGEFSGPVGLYTPFRDEIDPSDLVDALSSVGRPIALPCTPERGNPLTFRLWRPGDALVAGRYDTLEPSPEADIVLPRALVVPPTAFDRRGYRIGYGAGFYDRTIPHLQAVQPLTTVGFAFACQDVGPIPAEPHDMPLDVIATERELIVTIPL